jgi:primosomal protein N' (replication factor Y)
MYGTGTEAIEKELKKIFPERNIIRIDSDEPLSDQLIFKEKQTIVIGTQFAWNKLVWKDINLMIYADTDIALTIPEYKTNEHLWYSIRSAEYYLPEEAELYIQTRKPEHLVFSFLTHPEGFYEYELKERRKFKFPPFAYIIKLYYGGTTQTQGEQEAQKIKSKLQDLTNSSQNITISGPIAMKPHVRKKKYWYVLIVKVDYQYYKRDSKRILSHIPRPEKLLQNQIQKCSRSSRSYPSYQSKSGQAHYRQRRILSLLSNQSSHCSQSDEAEHLRTYLTRVWMCRPGLQNLHQWLQNPLPWLPTV